MRFISALPVLAGIVVFVGEQMKRDMGIPGGELVFLVCMIALALFCDDEWEDEKNDEWGAWDMPVINKPSSWDDYWEWRRDWDRREGGDDEIQVDSGGGE